MFRLPVSGLEVEIRQPSGAEDLLLQEAPTCNTELAVELVARLALPLDGTVVDWSRLTLTDLEAMLLFIRQSTLGDRIEADVRCSGPQCAALVTVSFGITSYLAHHRVRDRREIQPAEEMGWLRFKQREVRFRLPNAADQVAISRSSRPSAELARRCIQPERIPARLRRRAMMAMAALAPSLSGEMKGQCPECQRTLAFYFDVQGYVLRELRDQAAMLYEDIHLLALYYKWPEKSILRLPRNRRILYADMLRQQGGLS